MSVSSWPLQLLQPTQVIISAVFPPKVVQLRRSQRCPPSAQRIKLYCNDQRLQPTTLLYNIGIHLKFALIFLVAQANYVMSHRTLQGLELNLHLQESPKYERNMNISDSCGGKLKQPYDNLNEKYLADILSLNVKYRMTMASNNRQRATALIAREALLLLQGGDFVETGVYTGGTSAVMMHILMDFDTCGRKFYAFDSFAGLPSTVPQDRSGSGMTGIKGQFVVTQERYQNNLKRVNAWNESIIVISKGWFNETCARSPVSRISFLRLDGDIFVSTWDALSALYDRVVPGGYIYIDDYGSFNGCREAVDKFRTQQHIYEPLRFIREDVTSLSTRVGVMAFEAVWWQKRIKGGTKRKKSRSSESI